MLHSLPVPGTPASYAPATPCPVLMQRILVPGECIDVLGPSGTFGLRGGGEQLALLAREVRPYVCYCMLLVAS